MVTTEQANIIETHSDLSENKIAKKTFTKSQKIVVFFSGAFLLCGLALNFQITITFLLALLTAVYFADVLFAMFLVTTALHKSSEISVSEKELLNTDTKTLPTYSILCPLYHESKVLEQFVRNMEALIYPKEKLEILLLLEENDLETVEVAKKLRLPSYFKIVVIPHSLPKTKPKACNFGLKIAKGELIVIYDAEDQPEPWQLFKSGTIFKKLPEKICCLQARLNYYNPNYNLLTRLFTAEYSLWFGLVLPAFQSINTTIPLGGTSNHFKTSVLRKIGGWDAYNVTEDCDLGIRLFVEGYKTAIINSETLEEANSNVHNWIRQRSRWIKGYLQTYLVHMRNPVELFNKLGWHAFVFQLVIGARTIFIFINPLLWILTISYFVLYRFIGPTIESFYPSAVFYMAVVSLIFGNFLYLYNYMIAVAKNEQWWLLKYVFLIPFYWFLVSIASLKALGQLVFKPHYWEKTHHGLHLDKRGSYSLPRISFRLPVSPTVSAGAFLMLATIGNYFLNFLYNIFLTRSQEVKFSEFSLIALIGSFVYLSSIPIGALIRTVAHQSAYFLGGHSEVNKQYWANIRAKAKAISFTVALVWVAVTPLLQIFFNATSPIPFLIFTPVWIMGILSAVDVGFLTGVQKFKALGWLLLIEATTRLILTVLFVTAGYPEWVYLTTPLSMSFSFGLGYIWAKRTKGSENKNFVFSRKFFISSAILNLSSVVFMGGDIILASHFLPPKMSGEYAILSLIGKIVYFMGTLTSQLVVPIVSRAQGAGKNTGKYFNLFFLSTFIGGLAGFVFFGLYEEITVVILWGEKALGILKFLPSFTFAMFLFSLSAVIVNFHQTLNRKMFAVVAFAVSLTQVVFIINSHNTLGDFTNAALYSSALSFFVILTLHFFHSFLPDLMKNGQAFFGLFKGLPNQAIPYDKGGLKILVFNWRDIKHVWSGGAEVYIHELSKRWVRDGNTVTLFCGNDGKNERHEVIDGVKVIRRGGFYFVYVWAFFYYIFLLRGKFDVIIDCENGIPFFTPLFVKERVILLIHHVHKDIFKINFRPPISWIGPILESHLMRFVYRNKQVVTVSPSSKDEILANKLTTSEPEIIYNGVDLSKYRPAKKSKTPIVLYLGRLRFQKSIDVFIKTAKKVILSNPDVKFLIAGDGQQRSYLEKLTKELGLVTKVLFLGNVSEEEKVKLYQKAWVFMNPSMMEGFGVTVIEANACGTPVVASNVPGLRDSVSNPHSGFLVRYGDIDRFADRIRTLIDNERFRNESGVYAIAWAKQFDWDKSATKFLKLLKNEKNK